MTDGPVMRTLTRLLLLAAAIALGAAAAAAQTADELRRMSIEDLMNVEVTVVGRAPQPTSEVPAAVFVITRDDIRRSGATSLPEVLRLAPGLQVARLDAARYALGMRGFTDRLSRAMLVLIDGRAVYSPLFAGTFWEVQEVLLEDVERIEVIRGPGGTLWGANAVHGIISIVTRAAHDSQGLYAAVGAGTTAWEPLALRYGGRVGAAGAWRAYVKGFDRAGHTAPAPRVDDWRMVQGGARADWRFDGGATLTVQGDAYAGELAQRYSVVSFTPPFTRSEVRDAPVRGRNVLARWAASTGSGRSQVQAWYDRTVREEQPVGEVRDTFDLDVQRERRFTRHTVTFGSGYRVTRGRITALPPSAILPAVRTDQLVTAFVQEDVPLAGDRLRLVAGVKGEHNAYSGFEVQPSVRALWALRGSHRLVASVTRAVRTPSRVETDYTTTSLSSPQPAFVRLLPNPSFRPERLVAYELGYRGQPWPTLYTSASSFFHQLDDVLSTELLTPFVEPEPLPRMILPVTFENGLHGNSHGVEATADWRPTSWLRATGAYAWLRVQLTRDAGSLDVSQEASGERRSPRHQVQLQTAVDLPRRVQLDWIWRYTSRLAAGPVPAVATSDVRVAWRATPSLELAVVGQDLHQSRHLEWPGATPIRRSAYLSLTVRR